MKDLIFIGIGFLIGLIILIFWLRWFYINFNTLRPWKLKERIDKHTDKCCDKDIILIAIAVTGVIVGLVFTLVFGFGFIYNIVIGIRKCV